MKVINLRLRGLSFFRSAESIGVDEINIDFTQFDPGLICVYGDIGTGKSSLIENLTPFLKLPSHDGSLKNWFDLKDSCRDLTVQIGDDRYRFLININGISGDMERYVFKNDLPLNKDGSEKTYMAIVRDLFGSYEVYCSSLFMPQNRTPFFKLDPDKREELFDSIKPIQVKCKYAADQAKTFATKISELTGRKEQLDETIKGMAGIEKEIEMAEASAFASQESITATEARITTLNGTLSELQEKSKNQVALQTELTGINETLKQLYLDKTNEEFAYEKRLEPIDTDVALAKAEIQSQELLLDHEKLVGMQAVVSRQKELTSQIDGYITAFQLNAAAQTVAENAKKALELFRANELPKVNAADDAVREAKRASKLIYDVPCQKLADEQERKQCESCQFLIDAVKAENGLPTLQATAKYLSEQYSEQEKALQESVATAEAIVAENPFDAAKAKACKDERAEIAKLNAAEYVQAAEVAQEKLNGLRSKLTTLETQRNSVASDKAAAVALIATKIEAKLVEKTAIASKIDSDVERKISETKTSIEQAQAQEKSERENLTNFKKDVETLREKLQQRTQSEELLAQVKSELAAQQSEQADWLDLSAKLSRNGGIQSFMIEDSASAMTEFANELLRGYDIPWTIEIATSTKTSDGKKDKDGFFVFVNTTSGRRELADLSGGQKVLIDTILYHAVSYVHQSASGRRLETKIVDEADGSLDEESAVAYLDALRAAHKHSNLHHTIMISHRREIQRMISQRIRFVRGKGIEIERD